MKKGLIILFILFIIVPVYSQFYLYEDGKCILGPLRIRDNPSLSGQIIGRLQKNEEIIIESRTSYMEKINNDEDFWYLIDNKKGIKGYVFGAFIEINDENYNNAIYNPVDGTIINYDSLVYTKNFEVNNTQIEFFNSTIRRPYTGKCHLIHYDELNRNIFIITPHLEYGWINIDGANFNHYYKEIIDKKTTYEKYGNLFNLSKLYEMDLIKENNQFKRNGPLLSFTLSGQQYEFIDGIGGRGPYYNLIKVLNEKYILLSRGYYEGLLYDIYNLKTSEAEYSIYSIPDYSPSGNLFVGHGTFYDGWEEFRLFSISNNEIELLYEHIYKEQYESFEYIDSIEWKSESVIEIKFDDYTFELINNGEKWELSDQIKS